MPEYKITCGTGKALKPIPNERKTWGVNFPCLSQHCERRSQHSYCDHWACVCTYYRGNSCIYCILYSASVWRVPLGTCAISKVLTHTSGYKGVCWKKRVKLSAKVVVASLKPTNNNVFLFEAVYYSKTSFWVIMVRDWVSW